MQTNPPHPAAPPHLHGRQHRDDLGTVRRYDDQGRLHSDDGPAVTDPDGYAEFWRHGDLLTVQAPPLAA